MQPYVRIRFELSFLFILDYFMGVFFIFLRDAQMKSKIIFIIQKKKNKEKGLVFITVSSLELLKSKQITKIWTNNQRIQNCSGQK